MGRDIPPHRFPTTRQNNMDLDTDPPELPPSSDILIMEHQRPAFDKLVAVATACFAMQRKNLPIKPRTNSLIIGPSGSGKTYLANAVARELGVDCLSLSVGEWILLGCTKRGATTTWPMIYEFLLNNKDSNGAVIFIDEVDKVAGDTSWEAFLRAEVFRLLDFQVPPGLMDSNENTMTPEEQEDARDVLSNKTMIIGAGAFQHIWEKRSRPTVGFGAHASSEANPTLDDLAKTLPRELINRFRAELLVLPPLLDRDYRQMLGRSAEKLPAYLRESYLRLGKERIPEAARLHQGCRFLEELLLDVILLEARDPE